MEGLKILIVDDEPDIVEMLAYNFENEGMNVFKAFSEKKPWSRLSNMYRTLSFWM